MAGVYVHVPFCQRKCRYCDFYSVTNARQRGGFIQALLVEIKQRKYELEGQSVGTIYLGGGTPSMLNSDQISTIILAIKEVFEVEDHAEITVECNPGDLSNVDIQEIIQAGVNRISIGAQSFDPGVLSFLSRRHDADETREMYDDFRRAGITNISLDLMYGIPGTTVETVAQDLAEIIALRPEHISAYHLIYEEGTPLWNDLKSGQIKEVEEEVSLAMSHLIHSMLTRHGYEHYEISNYALPGFRSRHNSNYWTGVPYLGLGPSAHSYVHPWRSWNPADLDLYCRQLLHGAHFIDRSYEKITDQLAYEEYILTRLRTCEGIDMEEIRIRFGTKCYEHTLEVLSQHLSTDHIARKGTHYSLTVSGIDLSDGIIASFF